MHLTTCLMGFLNYLCTLIPNSYPQISDLLLLLSGPKVITYQFQRTYFRIYRSNTFEHLTLKCGLPWLSRMRGGAQSAHQHLIICGGCNFHANSIISISYDSCDVQGLFGTLVRFLRLLVWPQEVVELTNGKERKVIVENLGFVNF